MEKIITLLIIGLLFNTSSCEEGSQENKQFPKTTTESMLKAGDSCEDTSGEWFIEELIDASACEEGEKKEEIITMMMQKDCEATLSIPGTKIAFKGVVNGKEIYLQGTYRDMGKITKELFLTIEGQKLVGTAKWKYTDPTGLYSCKGTSEVVGWKK